MTLKRRRGWRPGLLSFGLVLVVGSMLGGVLLFDSVTTTTQVLVAATDLERGQVLAVSDVRVVEVSVAPGVNVLRLDEQSFLGGDAVGQPVRALRGFVPSGTLLSEDHFVVQSESIGPDDALFGLRLESGQYPSSLAVGDRVEMFVTSARAQGGTSTSLGQAEVWRIWQSASVEDRTDDLVADLLLPAAGQAAVVQAQAEGALRLTVVPEGGG